MKISFINEPISYTKFIEEYLLTNKPCIFSSEFTKSWNAVESWKINDQINVKSVFSKLDPELEIDVSNCDEFYFDSHCKIKMKVKDFVNYWEQMTNNSKNLYYLKDWHYFLNIDITKFQPFELLEYFSSDWLNEFFEIRRDIVDDYKFVYVGSKNTWTGLHADVLRSYSWSANICGRKRWRIFPEGSENKIPHGTIDLDKVNENSLPDHIDIIQESGEVIFIPSGWFHQVNNLTHCISINHNWLNGASLERNWCFLCSQLEEIISETKDVIDTPGYTEQCQICLKAYSGMNFQEFICMIEYILFKRVCFINEEKIIDLFKDNLEIQECTKKLQKWCEQMLLDRLNIFSNDWKRNKSIEIDIKAAINVLNMISTHKTVIELSLISESFKFVFLNKISFLL